MRVAVVAVADHKHAVVQPSAARCEIHHSPPVQLPLERARFHGHGDRADADGGEHAALSQDVGPVAHRHEPRAGRVTSADTTADTRQVWVCGIRAQRVLLAYPVKSLSHHPALAARSCSTVVFVVAADELLLAEVDKRVGRYGKRALNRAQSREVLARRTEARHARMQPRKCRCIKTTPGRACHTILDS